MNIAPNGRPLRCSGYVLECSVSGSKAQFGVGCYVCLVLVFL